MGIVRCEACGGNDLVKNGDFYVCEYCGCKYTVEDIRTQIINHTNVTNVNNNINAENVIISNIKDYEIKAGRLIKYNGEDRTIIVPDNVIEIGDNVFANTRIETIKFPLGLKSIQASALLQSILPL